MVISEDTKKLDGIVFSWLYVVRFVLRRAMSRWMAMRDAARECQARCINRSDTFDFSFLRLHYNGARGITDPAWLRLRASCRDWISLVEDPEYHRNGKGCSAFQPVGMILWRSREMAHKFHGLSPNHVHCKFFFLLNNDNVRNIIWHSHQ